MYTSALVRLLLAFSNSILNSIIIRIDHLFQNVEFVRPDSCQYASGGAGSEPYQGNSVEKNASNTDMSHVS